jgi:hypothetical protein
MRCDEVMRELNLPSDDRDDPALALHLAECKACARWAEHAARFNRLWDATRPGDPSSELWDRLWSAVTARLDHSVPITSPHSRPQNPFATVGDAAALHSSPGTRSWRGLAAIALVGLAQAAALFFAVNLFWNTTGKNVQPPGFSKSADLVQQTAPSLDSVVDVEWGQVILIRSERPEQVDITDLALLESSNGEDPWYDFFNRIESASTDVAMTE